MGVKLRSRTLGDDGRLTRADRRAYKIFALGHKSNYIMIGVLGPDKNS